MFCHMYNYSAFSQYIMVYLMLILVRYTLGNFYFLIFLFFYQSEYWFTTIIAFFHFFLSFVVFLSYL